MTFSAISTGMTRSSSAYIRNGLEARGRLEIRRPQEKNPKQYSWPIVGVLRCGMAWHMSTRVSSTSRELVQNLLPRHERAFGALDVIWWRKHQRRLLR